jgi:bacterioferritin-associated ferredoxin
VIVCHCHRITDRDIRNLVVEGASSARDVERACAAGLDCGGCRVMVERLLSAELERDAATAELAPAL